MSENVWLAPILIIRVLLYCCQVWQELPPRFAQIPLASSVGPALASGASAANSHNLQCVFLGHWCLPRGLESWKCLQVFCPLSHPIPTLTPPMAPIASDWCGVKNTNSVPWRLVV